MKGRECGGEGRRRIHSRIEGGPNKGIGVPGGEG